MRGPCHFPSMVRGAAIPESKPRLRAVRHAAPRAPDPHAINPLQRIARHARAPHSIPRRVSLYRQQTTRNSAQIARADPRATVSTEPLPPAALPASATRGDAGVTEAATAVARRQKPWKVSGGVRADRPQRRESSPRDPPQPRNGLLLQ